MIIEKKKIADLIPAPYNPRQSTAKQEQHLKESLEKFGLVEPIIFNKQTGYIVGGHFRVRELKKLGIKEIECVIVDLNEADEKELNIRLNANTGGWDWDTLANDWDVVDLEAWGLEIPQFDTVEELEASEDKYTQKIDTPVYEPKNEKPLIQELYNADKYKELVTNIENSSVTEEIKTLLKVAASRHIVFNYENIADFYAHSDKIVQQLMEDSALVIIDFNKAIELGFVNLSEEIAQQYQSEYGDE
jgi:hypothetical protein